MHITWEAFPGLPSSPQNPCTRTTRYSCEAGGWLNRFGATPIPKHTGIYKLHLEAHETLRTSTVREAVKLPPGLPINEWVAAKTLGIFGEVFLLVAAITPEVCSEQSCPKMSAGRHVSYAWSDPEHPVAQEMSAPEYMQKLVSYAHEMLSNGSRIPQHGEAFPECFMPDMKMLLKRFFRVYAHAYLHHFEVIRELQAEAHLNYCFKHYLFFVREFNLVADKDLAPLHSLIQKFDSPQNPELGEYTETSPEQVSGEP